MIRKTGVAIFTSLILAHSGTALGEETSTEPTTVEKSGPVEAPSIHVLLKKGRNSLFSISPDGSKVAFMQWSPAGYYMVVHSTADGQQIQDIPYGRKRPGSWRWLTDRRVVYSRGGQVFAVDIDGTNHLKLLSSFDEDRGKNLKRNLRAWSVKHLLPEDPEHILAQSWNVDGDAAIVKVNIYTGDERELVFEPQLDVDHWTIDRDGDVRLGVRYKKDEMQFLAFNNQTQKWEVYDDYSQDGANTLGHTGETYLTKRVSLESFDYDDDHIYMATNRNSDRFKLVKYNVRDKRIVEDVFASDRYDIGGGQMESTFVLFDDATESVVGLRIEEEKARSVWFDERFQKYQEMIDKHRPGYDNRIFDWSDDAKTLLIYSYSDVDPGRYSIFHPETKAMFTIAITNEELDSDILSKTRFIEYPARDDHTIHGYLNPATDGGPDKKLIILPHGGPFARDEWYFNAWVQYFATRGYNVLRVNFRGSTGYGREHLISGIRNIDTLMIDDIADGVYWAIQNNYADRGNVFIFGHSYGGYAALMSTVKYPDLYSAAVSWSAPVDILAQLKHYKREDAYFSYEYWKTAAGHPRKEKAALKRLSPLYNIDDLSVPLIAFHGEEDSTIPEEQAETFKEALERAEKDAEVVIIDNEGHTFSNNSNITYVLEKTLRFFSKHEAVPEGQGK